MKGPETNSIETSISMPNVETKYHTCIMPIYIPESSFIPDPRSLWKSISVGKKDEEKKTSWITNLYILNEYRRHLNEFLQVFETDENICKHGKKDLDQNFSLNGIWDMDYEGCEKCIGD